VEGSTHDASILANILERLDGLKIPEGMFYLADAGYACRLEFLPPFRSKGTMSISSHQGSTPKCQGDFNLRHNSLRVTAARALPALKNKFKILVQKLFHTFCTQVRLVLACRIMHNKILGWGLDEFFPVTPDEVGVGATDNKSWRNKRHEWADTMWANRGDTRI
jgi:hypothetical protein